MRLTNAEGVKDFDGVDKKTGFGYVIQDGIITIMQGTTIEPGRSSDEVCETTRGCARRTTGRESETLAVAAGRAYPVPTRHCS